MKSECHLCQMTVQNLAKCTKTRCRNFFCEKCIQENFDSTFTYHGSYKEGCWVCYACQNVCTCKLCKGELIIHNKKSLAKRKNKNLLTNEQSNALDRNNSALSSSQIGERDKDKDSSDEQLYNNDYDKGTSQDEKETSNTMKFHYKQPRMLNQRITKSLPQYSKDYHVNKFYRRKMLLKAN